MSPTSRRREFFGAEWCFFPTVSFVEPLFCCGRFLGTVSKLGFFYCRYTRSGFVMTALLNVALFFVPWVGFVARLRCRFKTLPLLERYFDGTSD